MSISAQLVKELRARTGAGILDSKHALEATEGNVDKAIQWLKDKGMAKAAKKSDRIAAEGLVYAFAENNTGIIIEINSETDFVAMNAKFKKLIIDIAKGLMSVNFESDLEALNATIDGKTIATLASEATASIGEKISFRRAKKIVKTETQNFGIYVHSNRQIASIVVIEGGSKEIAKNVSMHVSAMNPDYLNETEIPGDIIEEHRKDIMKELEGVEKPEKIKVQMAKGKMQKKLSEITLVDQTFVMEKKIVKQYLKDNNATAVSMIRYEVGEGIQKVNVDFASEVAQQMAK